MARKEVKEASRALTKRMRDESKRHHRPKRYAVITRLHPLTAEMTEGSLVLDDDDLVLSQWVEQYRKQYGLRVGDALTVHRMGNGDWVADDVISDRKVRRLKAKPKPGGGGEGEGGEEGGEEGEGGESEEPEEGSEELEEAEDEEGDPGTKALGALLSGGIGVIVHDEDGTVARGTEFSHYIWVGSVVPLNRLEVDFWMKPT